MNKFGESLRRFRHRCNDPYNAEKRLSQERLGELLGRELKTQGFSGAAVSDWERGKSKIHADDRLVLTSLITILHRQGSIRSVSEANRFLEVGNYRALNHDEQKKIFSDGSESTVSSSGQKDAKGVASLFLKKSLFGSGEGLKALLARTKDGPSPAWPRVLTALLITVTDRLSALHVLQVLLWVWIWLATWVMFMPSMRWPFTDPTQVKTAIVLYAAATFALPLLIGLLTTTRDNEFWQKHNLGNLAVTRLYTYQGAFIGLHLGYFAAFAISLLCYYLRLDLSVWFELALMAIPLLVGYTGAQLVPYNLWQAYDRLSLADGGIFFVFIMLGPLWGIFFWKFNPVILAPLTGGIVIFFVITLFVTMITFQYQRKGTSLKN